MTLDSLVVILGAIVSALSIICFFVGFVRSILSLQSALDRRLDNLSESISALEHRIELDEQSARYLTETLDNVRLLLTGQINQLNEKIDHRSSVFQDQIDQLSNYLSTTTGFQVRRRYPPTGG